MHLLRSAKCIFYPALYSCKPRKKSVGRDTLRTGRKLRPQSFSLLRHSLKRKVNREPHSVAKTKKAHRLYIWQSGLF
jgi:hypothetical protein